MINQETTSTDTSTPKRKPNLRRPLALALIVLGDLLLVLACVGHFTSLGQYHSYPAKEYDRLDSGLVENTRSLDALYREAERRAGGPLSAIQPSEAMAILFDLTCERFSHGGHARHTPMTNWLMWSASVVARPVMPDFALVAGPDHLLKYGHSALCGQHSFVLVKLAQKAGILARHVGLNGHVVMEAWYDDDWHMFDTDYEVMGGESPDAVASVSELARDVDSAIRLYNGRESPEKVRMFLDQSKLNLVSQPPWTPWHWKGNIMIPLESAAEVMKFVIPVLMSLFGVWLILARRATCAAGS